MNKHVLQFGDLTKTGIITTETLAVDFANKFFPTWNEVFNLGDSGVLIFIGDWDIELSLLEIEQIKSI